jgi:transposase
MSVSNPEALATVWFGIDVSKKHLDGAIWTGKRYQHLRVKNDQQGLVKLLEWARALSEGQTLKACMESTGDYGICCALFLSESGVHVSVVNPAWIKHYGMALGRLNKTDKADSRLIEQYAREQRPKASRQLADPRYRSLLRLIRRRDQLNRGILREDNRRECPQAIGQACLESINRILKALRAELREIEKQIRELIASEPELQAQAELIKSLPILGECSAWLILAEMPNWKECDSAASFAAAAGVQSTLRQSGTSSRSAPMSKCGRKAVRAGLHMPTLTGIKKMAELEALYDRLKARGLKHRQAMVACLRKLLMIVYGVLKSGSSYTCRVPPVKTCTP